MKYLHQYAWSIHNALENLDIQEAYDAVNDCALNSWPIFVMGNGGSCAVAEHLSCDFTKGLAQDLPNYPMVHSLVSNQALITAIANDCGYEHIFSKQLVFNSAHTDALVIAISSSGNSKNIIKGLLKARSLNYQTLALVGFDGGAVKQEALADIIIHVNCNNYGIVEDAHSIIMHAIAQQLRIEHTCNSAHLKL